MLAGAAIRRLEELSQNAWPSLQTMALDGWTLRFSAGYTKRANSVSPLYRGAIGAERKVSICEEIYSAKGLDTVFKLTPASAPGSLDGALSKRGYRFVEGASVQTVGLGEIERREQEGVETSEEFSEAWLSAFFEMSEVDPLKRETARQMLLNTVPRRCFASASVGGKAVACGLGVAEGGHVGVFDIVTRPGFRRRGLARAVTLSLLRWGERMGAETAYLQVVPDNQPALALYRGLGFAEGYRYWYRIKGRT
ncbi:MAG: GNAT family N-acetyltransferase [Nitrososphaerota archaeon]|nr:GNAT family N-acetyltransferase [Nitrososphaerota archaeon]